MSKGVISKAMSLTFSTSVRVDCDEGTGDGPTTGKGANTLFILLPPRSTWPRKIDISNSSPGDATLATGARKLEVTQVIHITVISS